MKSLLNNNLNVVINLKLLTDLNRQKLTDIKCMKC